MSQIIDKILAEQLVGLFLLLAGNDLTEGGATSERKPLLYLKAVMLVKSDRFNVDYQDVILRRGSFTCSIARRQACNFEASWTD